MGRIAKQKRQLIKEANQRLVEQEWYDDIDKYGFNQDGELEEVMTIEEFTGKVQDLKDSLTDIKNNVDIIPARTQSAIADDLVTLEHKIAVLWEKVKFLNLPRD